MYARRTVLRAQSGKLLIGKRKQTYIEITVVYHMGQLKRGFDSGKVKKGLLEKADENNCVLIIYCRTTHGFIGYEHVKYMNVISGGDPKTIVIKLCGGRRESIQPPMVIF